MSRRQALSSPAADGQLRGRTDRDRAIESAVVGMYTSHPSPSIKDKLAYASRRMELRLYCCGIEPEDYVGRDVLDAGCGTGEYSCWFASRGARVTGIDLSDGSLGEARAYAQEMGLDVRFEKRSVLDTGLPDGAFDLVYCTGVLHHTPDPFAGFAELTRLVRPGGKILVSLYNSFGLRPREVRRRVARFLGGDDLDRRVQWGRRLFPFTARRLMQGERNDTQSALYDYFAIPHETLHSVGEMLRWLDRLGLEYVGTFAPSSLRDYPPMFGHTAYGSVEKNLQNPMLRGMGKISHPDTIRRRRPGPFSRAAVQMLWLVTGVGVCSICGRKPTDSG